MNIHDLLAIDTAVTTAPVELGISPATGKPYGLLVVGLDSPQYRAEMDRQRFEGMAQRRAGNKDPKQKIDPETEEGTRILQERFQANLTATAKAVTVGWYGFSDANGETPFDPATAAKMIDARPTWRDKVLAGIENDAAFLPQPATDSPPTAVNTRGSLRTARTQKARA